MLPFDEMRIKSDISGSMVTFVKEASAVYELHYPGTLDQGDELVVKGICGASLKAEMVEG
jgi:hypothetical protein